MAARARWDHVVASHPYRVLIATAYIFGACEAFYAAEELPSTAGAISGWRIFVILFLMLGPIKILMPYVRMTRNFDVKVRRKLARRAIGFSFIALAIAGVLEDSNIAT